MSPWLTLVCLMVMSSHRYFNFYCKHGNVCVPFIFTFFFAVAVIAHFMSSAILSIEKIVST
jgi:hypothetical protein